MNIRIHLGTVDKKEFEAKLMIWAEAKKYGLQQCIIQRESMARIGWFIYSLMYTDKDHSSNSNRRIE